MTDETNIQNTEENKAPREPRTGPMDFKEGDKITVSRGKYRGQTGTVLYVDETKRKYAVRLSEDGLQLINEASVKAPDAGNVNVKDLRNAIDEVRVVFPHANEALDDLIDRLGLNVEAE